jgi:hypothetical protein
MATTTNYSWTTPDDTALVKDGAAAIRSLGTAIDSTVFTNAGNAIAKTIVDAKGDIIAATAADTVSRLAVGTNGQYLSANSSTGTGLEWKTVSTGTWTQAATGSITGSSITVSGLSGKTYLLILNGFSLSADEETVSLRLNTDTGSNYFRNNTAAETKIIFARAAANASTYVQSVFINLADTAAQIKPTTLVSNQGSTTVGGSYRSTSAITSLTFFPDSGTFDAGTYYVWSFA